MSKLMGMFMMVAAPIAALLALIPFAVIWSMNSLFPVLAIPYAWQTWLAIVVLTMIYGRSTITWRKRD